METIAIIDFVLLGILIFSAGWMFLIVSGYGGPVGKSFKIIGWGAILMGVSHLIETLGHHFFESGVIMFSHHFLATAGFVMIAYGFKTLTKPE